MDTPNPPFVGWHTVADAVPGAVGIQSGDEFVYVSEELTAMADIERNSLVGAHWSGLFDTTEATHLEEAIERARAEGRWEGTARIAGRSADDAPVELTLTGTEHGALVWAIAEPDSGSDEGIDRPVDEPSGPDARLAFLENVLDVVDDVLYVIDEDGQSRFWNEALVETTGYSHEEIASMPPAALIPEEQRDLVPGLLEAIDAIEDRRVEVDILTKDGERITHEFRGTTFEDPETGEMYRCGSARDVTERTERERELERYETIVQTVDDGIYALDEELRFSFVSDGFCEMLGRPREELVGLPAPELFVYDDESAVADDVRERVVAGDTSTGTIQGTLPMPDGERIFESRYRLHPEPDGQFRGSVGIARDVTERERRERALERRRDELTTLNGINELLLETVRELIQTSSRDAVERVVCERLAASDLYEFAWIGERELDGDRIRPRVTGGDDGGYLEEVTITDDGSETGTGPAGRAMETGAVQAVTVDDSSFEPWRDAARERGFESVAAIPLQYGETVYGVLVVYSTRTDAFSPRKQAGFGVLGRTIGSVIHAARSRELLFADAVAELEFSVSGTDSVFVTTAAETGRTLTLDGFVPSGTEWILYLTVDGGSPDDVISATSEDSRVERSRIIESGADGGRIELVVAESSLLHTVTEAGATVRAARADRDGAELLVEAPTDADVRELVKHVQEAYPGSELVAHRERNHEVTTVGRPGRILDELTNRQRESLEAAYRTGYFDWPRESTAEEVAATLDLAAPTLHGHLRKAEWEILSELFGAAQAGPER